MKKLAFLIMFLVFVSVKEQANAQVNITVNFGSQPDWGPVGYDYVDYYYMPDIDAYYYVPQRQYIYFESNHWIFARALPSRYRWYNPYTGYKVVVNEPKPYLRHEIYRAKYKGYKGGHGPKQVMIRDSHDERYKNNKQGNNGHKDNGNGKNKGRGNGKGHGKHH